MILESESTVVYTGAGVSASTGISTYRGLKPIFLFFFFLIFFFFSQ